MKPPILVAALMLSAAPALAQSAAALGPDPSGYSYAPSAGDQPTPVKTTAPEPRRRGSVFVLRAGSFSGSGSASAECDGSLCSSSSDSQDYDEDRALILEGDWLFHTSSNLRLGVGLSVIPTTTVKFDGTPFELGTIFGTDFVAEGVFDLSQRTTLALRGSVGLSMLFPSGDLDDAATANSDACFDYEYEYSGSCEADVGPYLGVQAAVGPGLVYNLGQVGLRMDLQFQVYSMRTLQQNVEDSESAVTFAGIRPMLLAGIEL